MSDRAGPDRQEPAPVGSDRAGAERLRLDYVSPLPPARTGIAHYSTDLLPLLEPRCDLRVVRLPGQPLDPAVEARWGPVSSDLVGEPGRLPLYHMGNNQYHVSVLELAMRHPGVVVLHDLVLHHFLLGTLVGGTFDDYRRRLVEDHGWVGEKAAASVRWGVIGDSLQFSLPVHRRLVRRQRGVLVHSDWARSMLLEEEPDVRVEAIPMGIPLPPGADREAGLEFRRRWGVPPEAPLLGSFGFQTPIKRPQVAIPALARPQLAGAHLVVAGEVASTLELEGLIAECGVGARVHVTGFLDYGEFEAAIAACDLCLNLRYPTAGETSAALLRVLAVGRPTAVSDYAQFADLPPEIAVRIPLGDEEVDALAAAAGRLLAAPQHLARMGEAARAYVGREHDPESAAAAVVAACAALAGVEPPPRRPVELPAPTTIAWSRLPGTLEVEGHEAPWAGGERRRLVVRLTNRGPARWLAASRGMGGVVLRTRLLDEEGGLLEQRPWLPLRHDLEMDETVELAFEVRRPLGGARLRIEPHVVGHYGFRELGGPWWESAI